MSPELHLKLCAFIRKTHVRALHVSGELHARGGGRKIKSLVFPAFVFLPTDETRRTC